MSEPTNVPATIQTRSTVSVNSTPELRLSNGDHPATILLRYMHPGCSSPNAASRMRVKINSDNSALYFVPMKPDGGMGACCAEIDVW
ncbi:hypothetical protein SODALDRAFT_360789 [Sodiomyces alkalinus F11]|uniref:Uncharacterized protein n=1 Tax=Sodiomyces alkalinus (strain CBS 110278 / VKM F-3762 / F11) TaxID=1314773 RepID=A0A3N2PRG6_SODAK|nr:hypothetical protein SODALDRAFT_360789 [Sodiomyces alkalinus F11]ROT37109.1 hypothetical protein SODALDRAFT_360789 [Sodiomyces alkalinus F11]